MPLSVLMIAAIVIAGHPEDGPARLVEPGPDFGHGTLVNASCGARPTDPFDPAKYSFVIVHGLNPFHPMAHFVVGPRYAEALRARFGSGVNIGYWDWNGATTHGLSSWRVRRRAVKQGDMLAETLLAMGVSPANTHIIGQSAGCVLVASTAARLHTRTATPVRQVTLIDPAWQEHVLIFEQLRAGCNAQSLEHLWVPGASGFGAPAPYANVANLEIPGPNGWRGLLNPNKLDHLHAVDWHIRALTR